MKYKIAVASVVGLSVSLGLGCSSLPTDIGEAQDLADPVNEQRERSSDQYQSAADKQESKSDHQESGALPPDSESDTSAGSTQVELTMQEEDILSSVDFVLMHCPLEGAPYHEEDSPYHMRHAIDQCEKSHPGLEAQLADLDPEKQDHPDVRQARADIDRLGEQIEYWQQEIADREVSRSEDRDTYEAYQAFLDGEQTQILRLLFDVRQGTIPGEHNIFMPKHRIGERVQSATSLKGLGDECRERFDNDRDFHNFRIDAPQHPENTCDVLDNWKKYMAKYLNLHAAHTAQELSTEVARLIEVLEENGYTMDSNRARLQDLEAEQAELEALYGEHFETLDAEFSDDARAALAAIAEQQSRYEQALATAVREQRWDSSNRHRESEVRNALDRVVSGTEHRIRDYSVGDVDWNIERSAEGAPVARYHNGVVLTQRSGENYCRIYNFYAAGQFDGTGYTTARIRMNLDDERYVLTACP